MNIKASLITAGVISAISGVVVIYEIVAKRTENMRDFTFEITGNGAIIFGVFMLVVGLALIIYGAVSI